MNEQERAALGAIQTRHREHVHSGGCHRRFDHASNQLVDLEGPAGYCEAGYCGEDWPCDAAIAVRAALATAPPDHGLCCECFDGPNMAAGHEHWGE